MKKILLSALLFVFITIPHIGFCTILHVPATYSTIQEGIIASVDGDIVLVEPGTYYENLNLYGKNIILCSNYFTTGNPGFISNTIIDGSNSGRVITFDLSEISSCQVIGFTIQHGNSSTDYDLYGGGILILDASPQIRNCIIKNNSSPLNGGGGGIAIIGFGSGAKVLNCTIQNNTAGCAGGGVYMGDCNADAEIVNCIISGNTNTNDNDWNGGGGGVNLVHTGKLVNCLIANNSAPNSPVGGGGVYCDWGDYYGNQNIFIIGCTITNNTALNWGGTSNVINGGEFQNCIIWGNTDNSGNPSNYDGNTFVYCCSDPLPDGWGNISLDPLFADTASGNFRLLTGSPCINAGDNGYNYQPLDLDGNYRINDYSIDMGAYENGSGITVQIGNGSDISGEFPIYSCYDYSYSQQIYLGSEINDGNGTSGFISKIRFYYAGGGSTFSNWNNWTVYLGNTAKTEFAGTADWVPVTSMNQVFSGTIPDPVPGTWVEILLPTPFHYTGSNIVVAIDENSNSYDCTAFWSSFYTDTPRGLLFYDYGINPDPASPPEANSGLGQFINQVQFEMNTIVGTLEGIVAEQPNCTIPIAGATITTGNYSATSDETGHYQLSLPVGIYNVTALFQDESQTISSINIDPENTTTQDFCLQPYYAPPVNLQANVTGPAFNDVHLTWMPPGSVADQWIHWDQGIISGGLGYGAPATFSVASRWPVSDIEAYDGTYLKKIRFAPADPNAAYTLKVWKGTNASTLLHSQVVTNPFINGWNDVTLTSPILIDGTEEFWFGYEIVETVDGYPAGLGPGPAVVGKGDMINSGYGWFSVKDAWGWEFNWTLQGFVSESSVLDSQQSLPMVQNLSSQPIFNDPIPVSVQPKIIQFIQPDVSNSPNNLAETGVNQSNPETDNQYAISSAFTGYNVYRDNIIIASNIPDLSYDDPALPKGAYDYEVSAQYDYGESERIGPVHVDIYTCFPPTNLTVSNLTLTTTTANLYWTPSTLSTNLQWDLEWGPAGFTHGLGTNVLISTTPGYSFTGLTAGTAYDVYVRTHCSASDASAWVKKTFRTYYFSCPAGSTAEPETCGSATNNGCEMIPPATGTINNGEIICGTTWLNRTHRDTDWYSFTITGPSDVTLTGQSEFLCTFGIASAPCSSAIFYSSHDKWAGENVSFVTQLVSAGTYYVFIAPVYTEQLNCDSLNLYWFQITSNSCLTPVSLNATIITATSADLSWTSGSPAWNIEWGPAGFAQGNGTMITGITSNPFTLNGLTTGNTYSYFVQSNCGSGATSNWAGPFTFYLPCPAVSLPYTEDFSTQAIGSPPQCWQLHGSGALTNWLVNIGNSAGGNSPEIDFCYYNPYFYERSYLMSPVINTSGQTTLDLSFKSYIYSLSSESSCEVWTTSDGGTTWNPAWSFAQMGIWGPETINLSISTPDVGSSTFQFAFAINGSSWQIEDWNIDDISLTGVITTKTLNLKAFIEGLYAGAGVMNQASDGTGPHFGAGIADQVTIELHNPIAPYSIAYSFENIDLLTNGEILINSIPGEISGSYYLVIKHRNSLETWTNLPVDLTGSGPFDYDLSLSASQSYGNNLKMMGSVFVIYGGDESQDGIVDGSDMAAIDNASTTVLTGYNPEDVNGDGIVDGSDMALIDNNATSVVQVSRP